MFVFPRLFSEEPRRISLSQSCQGHLFGKKHRTIFLSWRRQPHANESYRGHPCGSDSSQAPVQRSPILSPNKYRMLPLIFLYLFESCWWWRRRCCCYFFRFGIRPSNVHAYTREVRPAHANDRVARKANYGLNGLLVTVSEGSQFPIDCCQVPYGTTQSMQKKLRWSYALLPETSSNCPKPDHCR